MSWRSYVEVLNGAASLWFNQFSTFSSFFPSTLLFIAIPGALICNISKCQEPYFCCRILGFYVSGFVMIVISVDRLSAIIYPLAHRANTRRTRWWYDELHNSSDSFDEHFDSTCGIMIWLVAWLKESAGSAECDIHIDFDTNEYPNIFVSKF